MGAIFMGLCLSLPYKPSILGYPHLWNPHTIWSSADIVNKPGCRAERNWPILAFLQAESRKAYRING